MFQAEEGRSYQIELALGSLPGSSTNRYDSDGEWQGVDVTRRGDFGVSQPQLPELKIPEAERSGSHYVSLAGPDDETGSYTLTITAL